MGLKIVITGASGHIGTRVCQRIGTQAHVVALVGSAEGRDKVGVAGAAETHVVDLDKPDGLAALFAGADAVCVITAGMPSPSVSATRWNRRRRQASTMR